MDSSQGRGQGSSSGAGSSSASGSPLLRPSLPALSVIPPRPPRKPGMPKLTIPSRPSSSSSNPSLGGSGPGMAAAASSSQSYHPSGPGPSKLSHSITAGSIPASVSTTTSSSSSSGSSSLHAASSSLTGAGGSNNGPPSLSIRTSGAGSSSTGLSGSAAAMGANLYDEEGYEGFVGSGPDAYQQAPSSLHPGSLLATTTGTTTMGASSGSKGTIYPDTIPHLGLGEGKNADPAALTNDLRRAIGGLSIGAGEAEGKGPTSGAAEMAGRSSAAGEGLSSHETPGPGSGNAPATAGAGAIPGLSASSAPNGAGVAPSATNGHDEHEDQDMVLKGNLEIIGRLGEGASGEVMKAVHKPTGLVMAIKSISTSPNPAIHRQILRELSFNRTCHSDYIVRYYGAFLSDSDSSIVVICMEHCEGGSLDGIYKMVKKRNGRTGEKVLGKVAEAGLKGLEYLRERKIIHRDIKPSNILLTRDGGIKLCDFGVSGELINSVAGTFTGTGYYMAPERIQGLPYNISSDVWSLGLSILEVASNRFPFPPEGEPPLGPIDLLSYIITMRTPELQDDERGGVKWGKAFRDFLERCLEKDPAKRPGPKKMLSHPFVRKSETRVSQADIARFVAEVWGWSDVVAAGGEGSEGVSGSSAAAQDAPSSAAAAAFEALSRIPSLRRAPPTPSSASSTHSQALGGPSAPAPGALRPNLAASLNPLAQVQATEGEQDPLSAELQIRAAQERAAARMREADAGLIGSPTSE